MGVCRAGDVLHMRLAAKGPPGPGLIQSLFLPVLLLATISVGVADASQEQAVLGRPISQPPVLSNYSGTRKQQRRQQGQHPLGQQTSRSILHSTGSTRRLMRAEMGSLADKEARHEGVKDDPYHGVPPWNAESMMYGKQSSNSGSAVDAAAEEAARNAIAEGLAPVDVALAANYAARSAGGSHQQCVEASLSASIQAALAAGGTALHVGKTAGEAISAAGGDAKDKMTAAVAAATQAAMDREGDPLVVAKVAAATAQATGASVADMVIAATNAATRAAMATETSPDKVGELASDAAKLAGASPAEVIKAAGFGAMTASKTFGGSTVDTEKAQESAEQAALKRQEIENEQRAEEQRIENERKDEQERILQAEVQRQNLLRATEQVEQQRKAAENGEQHQDVPQEKPMEPRQQSDIRKIEGADDVTVGLHEQLIHPPAVDPPLYMQRQMEEPQRHTQAEFQTNQHAQGGNHDGKHFDTVLQGAPQAEGEAVRQLVVQPAPQLVVQPAPEEQVILRDQHDFQQHANRIRTEAESQTKVDVTQSMPAERGIGTIQPGMRVQRSVDSYMPAQHEGDTRVETHKVEAGVKQSIQPELEIGVTQPDMKARDSVEFYVPAKHEADAKQKTHQEEAGVQPAADTSRAQERAQAMDAAQRELAVQTFVNSKIAAQREAALHAMAREQAQTDARHHAEATQRKLDAQRKQALESIYYGDAQDEARKDAVDELRYMRLMAAQRDAETHTKSRDSMLVGAHRQGESKNHGPEIQRHVEPHAAPMEETAEQARYGEQERVDAQARGKATTLAFQKQRTSQVAHQTRAHAIAEEEARNEIQRQAEVRQHDFERQRYLELQLAAKREADTQPRSQEQSRLEAQSREEAANLVNERQPNQRAVERQTYLESQAAAAQRLAEEQSRVYEQARLEALRRDETAKLGFERQNDLESQMTVQREAAAQAKATELPLVDAYHQEHEAKHAFGGQRYLESQLAAQHNDEAQTKVQQAAVEPHLSLQRHGQDFALREFEVPGKSREQLQAEAQQQAEVQLAMHRQANIQRAPASNFAAPQQYNDDAHISRQEQFEAQQQPARQLSVHPQVETDQHFDPQIFAQPKMVVKQQSIEEEAPELIQHCFAWAYQGYCSSPMHESYMADNCAFECVAKDFESTAIESFDEGEADPAHQCINWADIGLCSHPHYSIHMMKICAEVCATKKAAVQEHPQLSEAPVISQQEQLKLRKDVHLHTAHAVPQQHATQGQLGPQRQFTGTSEVHTDIDDQLNLGAHQGAQHREPQQVTIPPQRSRADAEAEGAPPQDIALQQQPYRKQFPLAQQQALPKEQTLKHRTGPGDDPMSSSMPVPAGQLERRPFEAMQRRVYADTPQIPDAPPNPSIGQVGRRPFEAEQQRVYSEPQQQTVAPANRATSPQAGRRHFEIEQQRVYSELPQQLDALPNQLPPQQHQMAPFQQQMAHQQLTGQPAWPQQPPPHQPPAQQPPPHPEEVPLQPLPFHDPLPPPSVSNSPLAWPQASRTAPPAAQLSASSLPDPSSWPSVIRADTAVPPVPLPVTPTEDSQWTPPPDSGSKPAVESPTQGGANESSNPSSSEGIGHRRRTSSSNSIGSMEPRRSPYMKGPRPPSEALTIAPSVVMAGRCSDTEGLGIISDEQQCQAASSFFGSTYSGTGNWPWMPRGCTRSAHNVIKFNRNADAVVACGQDYACICDKVISWYSTVSSGVCEDWPGRFTVSNARDCRTAADRMGLSWRGSGNFTILAKGCNSNKYDGVHYNDNKESPRQCGYGEQDCICSDTRVLLQPGEKANPFWFTLLADDLSTAEEFEMSFNLKPHAPAPHDGWANILRITVSDTEHGNYGDMMPAFYFIPGTTRLRVAMGRQDEHDAGCDVGGSGLILGQTARVIARLIGDTFAVYINGAQGCVATGYDSKYTASPRARVYISDAFSSPAQVTVSDLIYRSQVGSQLKRIVPFPVAGLIVMEVDDPTEFVTNVETQTAAENAIAVMANIPARDVKAELSVEGSQSLLADASTSWRAGGVNVKYTIDSIDEVSGNTIMGGINDRSLTNVTVVMNGELFARGLGAGYTVKVTSSWAQEATATKSIEAVEGKLLQPDASTSTEMPSNADASARDTRTDALSDHRADGRANVTNAGANNATANATANASAVARTNKHADDKAFGHSDPQPVSADDHLLTSQRSMAAP